MLVVIRNSICTCAITEHSTDHVRTRTFAAHTTCCSLTFTFYKFSNFFTGLAICNPYRLPWYIRVIWSLPVVQTEEQWCWYVPISRSTASLDTSSLPLLSLSLFLSLSFSLFLSLSLSLFLIYLSNYLYY